MENHIVGTTSPSLVHATLTRSPSILAPLRPSSSKEPFFRTLNSGVKSSLCVQVSESSNLTANSSSKENELENQQRKRENRRRKTLGILLGFLPPSNSSSSATQTKRHRTTSEPILRNSKMPQSPLNPSSRERLSSAGSSIHSRSPVAAFALSPNRRLSSSPKPASPSQNHHRHSSKSLIHTAKYLIEQLEQLWAEVADSPSEATTPTSKYPRSPQQLSVTINGIDWTSAARGTGSAVAAAGWESEDSNNLFFFGNGGGTATDATEIRRVSGSSFLDSPVLRALKDDKVVNNAALVPIIANLQELVNDEDERRNSVLGSIKELHDHLFESCERLCVPIETFIHHKGFPASSSIYVKRDMLVARVSHVDQIIRARQERLNALKDGCLEIRKVLEDLSSVEFQVTAPDDLSASTIESWAKNLYDLEEEKAKRQSQIAKTCAKIHKLSSILSRFPSASEEEVNLTQFLQSPLPTFENEDSLPALPNSLASASDPTITAQNNQPRNGSSSVYTQIVLEQHYRALLQSGNSTVTVSISLTRACIAWLQALADNLDAELQSKRDLCKRLVKEIGMCLEELGRNPEEVRLDEEDLGRIEEYTQMADSLREEWKKKMQEVVVGLLVELTNWWDKCHIVPEERKVFTVQFGDNLFSPLTVETITLELLALQDRYELEYPMYSLIEQRTALLEKMVDFEKSASDPRRLFRSSFQLNEEERFRKTCVPNLLKVEESLRGKMKGFEQEQEKPFIFRGSRYLDVLEKETSERFLNEALFIFDTTGMAQTRTSVLSTTPGKTRRPSVNANNGSGGAGINSPKLTAEASSSVSMSGKRGVTKSASMAGIGGMVRGRSNSSVMKK
ncbi:microtubule associated protein-domain-containing protein [Obelidium mucronatum]|nr:microtubule associated protein-domain-containing protein [Obelidium mucronatum]